MSLKLSGFTLIELLIVIAILAIIAAVAIPSYNSYVDRGKRAEARTALLDIAARQERFYSNNRQYTAILSDLRMSGTSENGYYTLSVALGASGTASGSNTQTFRATATPAGWTDDECGTLGIDETGAKTQSPSPSTTCQGGPCDRAFCWGK